MGLNAGTAPESDYHDPQHDGVPARALLHYQLYRNAARTFVWGETVGGNTVFGTGNGRVQILRVYGDLPASQSVPSGSYSDTITVTITFLNKWAMQWVPQSGKAARNALGCISGI